LWGILGPSPESDIPKEPTRKKTTKLILSLTASDWGFGGGEKA